jgi:alginate O-acetyltransferase complex protein AlgI
VNYAYGRVLRRKPTPQRLWIGIALNVLPLAFFKYLPPLLELGLAGSWHGELARHILLPVGMSFWTFQALSYLFDLYFEEELDPSLLEFCLYMAFWPTVLSGPICRLPAMLPQLRERPRASWEDLSVGSWRFVQGVIMKFVFAQVLALGWSPGEGVTAGFDGMKAGWGGADVWFLGIGFGFLLFFDFAGYSHMVIGAARILGIRTAENFDRPFLSPTPSIFWTRWHMSLSFWIRDYVFNPLAAAGRRYRWWPFACLVIAMTLFGVWHGPKWTYVLYGVYHGVVLVMHRLGQRMKPRVAARVPRSVGGGLSWAATFAAVAVGFVIFRAGDVAQLRAMLTALLTPAAYGRFAMPRQFYLVTAAIVVGYFAVAAAGSLLRSWRARYREVVGSPREFGAAAAVADVRFVLGGVFEFLAERFWWWAAPALSILAFFVVLVVRTQKPVVALTPFIYTLF